MSQHVAKLEDGTENHLKTGGEQITYANKATAGSVDPRCKEVFTQLKIRRKHRYIVYKIDPETEAVVVETIGARDADLDACLFLLGEQDRESSEAALQDLLSTAFAASFRRPSLRVLHAILLRALAAL